MEYIYDVAYEYSYIFLQSAIQHNVSLADCSIDPFRQNISLSVSLTVLKMKDKKYQCFP
jgi:hypothetical protein